MKRADQTDSASQRAWRGRHEASTGNWSYPKGDGRAGTEYLRCGCGWRLIEVYRKPHGAEERAAAELFRAHLAEVKR